MHSVELACDHAKQELPVVCLKELLSPKSFLMRFIRLFESSGVDGKMNTKDLNEAFYDHLAYYLE